MPSTARIDVGSLVLIDNNSIQGGDYDTAVDADLMSQQAATGGFISGDGLYRVLSREHVGALAGTSGTRRWCVRASMPRRLL